MDRGSSPTVREGSSQKRLRQQKHPQARKGLRVFRVTGFERILLLYLPLLDGVEILRVVHGSRNLQALLRREGLV